ncbi:MAG: ftsB [Herminiimonas sp.]|jgi:cell division protein FtsB|nr:ftsB [Herminiimonas sp.]
MRLILLGLAALLLLIQYPLWLGKGGWLRVWDLDQQVSTAHARNEELKARNAKLNSEVMDLKEGTGAVEERARYELGMIKENEIFVQILEAGSVPPPVAPPAPDKRKP